MTKLEQIYQNYLDAPYIERVREGMELAEKIKKIIAKKLKITDDWKLNHLLILICKSFLGADDKLQYEEYEFLRDVLKFNANYSDVFEALNNTNADFDNKSIAFIDILNREEKLLFVIFGILLCVADGVLTVSEKRSIERFLA